jgi:class 3 adenylate cyclase
MADPRKNLLDLLSQQLPPIATPSTQVNNLSNIFRQPLPTITPTKSIGIKLKIATPRNLAENKLKTELQAISKMDLNHSLARVIPALNSLTFADGKEFDTAFLFMDIRKSSSITKLHLAEDAAKIYKLFFRAMTFAGKYYGGRIGGFAGDRIMIVFPFATDKTPRSNAAKTAIYMQYILKNVLNPMLSNEYRHPLEAGIGIDFGETLVIRVGQQGEGNNDRVWAGDAVNSSSKLADIGEGIYISQEVYKGLSKDLKEGGRIWLPPQETDNYYEYIGDNDPV